MVSTGIIWIQVEKRQEHCMSVMWQRLITLTHQPAAVSLKCLLLWASGRNRSKMAAVRSRLMVLTCLQWRQGDVSDAEACGYLSRHHVRFIRHCFLDFLKHFLEMQDEVKVANDHQHTSIRRHQQSHWLFGVFLSVRGRVPVQRLIDSKR